MNNYSKDRILPIQGIRAVAFMAIFLSHCGVADVLGAWGVSVFFVLSGFCMQLSYDNRDLKCGIVEQLVFSINKIKKLYPLHICMLLLTIPLTFQYVLDHWSVGSFIKRNLELLANVFLLQSWVPRMSTVFSYNGVAWYLSDCIFIYMMFPFVRKKIKEIHNCISAVISIIFIIFLQCAIALGISKISFFYIICDDPVKWMTYICPIYRLGDFVIGCILYNIFKWIISVGVRTKWIISGEILSLGLCIAPCILYDHLDNTQFISLIKYDVLFLPGTILLILTIASERGILARIMKKRLLVKIGDYSAWAFLIHYTVISYWNFIQNTLLDKTGMMEGKIVFGWIVTIIVCHMISQKKKKHVECR